MNSFDDPSDDSYFHMLVESGESTDEVGAYIEPNHIILAKNFLQYNRPQLSLHSELLMLIAPLIIDELDKCRNWISSNAAIDGVLINFAIFDSARWKASIRRQGEIESDITIGLGCIPRLFGIANRLDDVDRNNFADLLSDITNPLLDRYRWKPSEDPMGFLTFPLGEGFSGTTQITSDALLLILLHEAAHACRGHFHIKNEGSNIYRDDFIRALETDADLCAGYLFVIYQLCSKHNNERPSKDQQKTLISRLVKASHCQHSALQIYSSRDSPKYHLPSTRALDTLRGAEIAWRFCFSGDVLPLASNDSYTTGLLIDSIMHLIFPAWVARTSEDALIDQEIHDKFTLKILCDFEICNQLRLRSSGPLKVFRDRWDDPRSL